MFCDDRHSELFSDGGVSPTSSDRSAQNWPPGHTKRVKGAQGARVWKLLDGWNSPDDSLDIIRTEVAARLMLDVFLTSIEMLNMDS